jgi:serine/threonine protein kinase
MFGLTNIQPYEKGKLLGEGRHKEVYEVINADGTVSNLVVAFIKANFTSDEQSKLIVNQLKAMDQMREANIPIYCYIGAASDIDSKRMFLVKERSPGQSLREFNQDIDEVYNNIGSKQMENFIIFILKNLTTDFPVDIDKPLDNIFYSWEDEEYHNVDSLEPGEKDAVYRITIIDLMEKVYLTFIKASLDVKKMLDIKNTIKRTVELLGIPSNKFLSEFTEIEIAELLEKLNKNKIFLE